MPNEPIWLTFEDVLQAHQRGLKNRPGADGIRDDNVIHSAIQAPKNLFEFDEEDDVLALAIRLCARLCHNHGFVDGNKRAAAGSMMYFLGINGFKIAMDDTPDFRGNTQLSRWIERLAAHDMDEDQLYDCLEPHVEEIAQTPVCMVFGDITALVQNNMVIDLAAVPGSIVMGSSINQLLGEIRKVNFSGQDFPGHREELRRLLGKDDPAKDD